MFLRKFAVFSIFMFFNFSSPAQFISAEMGIDGLTCSMCSNSTEKSIRKLDFVKDVKMDLNKNIAEITFIEGKEVSIEGLARKVEEAGFSVRYIYSLFNLQKVNLTENQCFTFENATYRFIKADKGDLHDQVKMKFIGEKYQGKKVFKTWKDLLNKAAKEPGCDKDKKQYFVTL